MGNHPRNSNVSARGHVLLSFAESAQRREKRAKFEKQFFFPETKDLKRAKALASIQEIKSCHVPVGVMLLFLTQRESAAKFCSTQDNPGHTGPGPVPARFGSFE